MNRSMFKSLRYRLVSSLEALKLTVSLRRYAGRLKVIIGSASTRQQGWVSTNYPTLDLTDERTFHTLFKRKEAVERFLAEHVWEHLSLGQAEVAARNCRDYLKKGGVIRVAVPDGYHPDPDYIAQVKPGGYGPGADDHKLLYNYRTLSQLFIDQGYEVSLLEWFDDRIRFGGLP